ncbi:MAG: lysophospholipid acyltransferase family protein [Hyphomicrobiales bacterium]
MIRSLLYTLVFYVETVLFLVLGSWLLFAPRSWAMAGLAAHGAASVWLLEKIVGTRMVVRGKDRLPPGPVIVAAKHQSAWDTFALIPLLKDPAMIMKRELGWIPIYGWFSHKFRMIFVHREAGPAALRRMARDAKDRAAAGREIVIFPEGTRRAPGAPPDYKPGIAFLYGALGVPVCPVALNSGLYWPRRSFARYPGDIVVEFLDPIPPGLPRGEFMARLEQAIETASAGLIAEAARSPTPPPTLPRGAR